MADDTSRRTPMAMCPMAGMCKRMMDKPPTGLFLMLPGAALIAVGVLILVEPAILVWLAGAASVLFGVMLIAMGGFVRRLGVRLRDG